MKEIVISIIVVLIILVFNGFVQHYTVESVDNLTNKLLALRDELIKEETEVDTNKTGTQIGEAYDEWKSRDKKLAYFIEHNELESVESNLTSLKSFIETKGYGEAVSALDKSVFVLKHIEDKYAFNLENIL